MFRATALTPATFPCSSKNTEEHHSLIPVAERLHPSPLLLRALLVLSVSNLVYVLFLLFLYAFHVLKVTFGHTELD